MKKLVLLCVIFLFILTISGCIPKIFTITKEDIKDVIIWTHTDSRALTKDEITEFIRLYNLSLYGNKITGEGGTPDFGLRFTLIKNNKTISINDCYGKIEPIGNDNANRYIESKELYDFIKILSETIQK